MSIKVLSSLAPLTDPFFTITKKLASQLWPAFVWLSVTPALFYLRGKMRESHRRNKMIISLLKKYKVEMQMQAWFAESSRGFSCDSQTCMHQLNSLQEFKLWMKPPSSYAGAASLVSCMSCIWGRGSVEETFSLFPAVQHACLKWKSPKEESKISFLIQGQKKKWKSWEKPDLSLKWERSCSGCWQGE